MTGGVTETVFQVSSDVGEQETVTLGSFVTAPYERIRVLALVSTSAPQSEMELTLSFVQEQGTPGPLDRVLVGPNSTFTQVYDLPGIGIQISARAPSAASSIAVYVWGRRGVAEGFVLDQGKHLAAVDG